MVTIAADHLAVTLGGRRVVEDVSVHLAPRQLVGILGPNGAGKSTFVRALLGLIRHGGTVTIDGERPDRATIARIGFALAESEPVRDVEGFADRIDVIMEVTPDAARIALAPMALDADYHAAMLALGAGA